MLAMTDAIEIAPLLGQTLRERIAKSAFADYMDIQSAKADFAS
jgi:hypothetical protein